MNLSLVGTWVTLSPEQYQQYHKSDGIKYDSKVDVWALGCILYFMLSGKHFLRTNLKPEDPRFANEMKKLLEKPIPFPQHLSRECKDLLSKLLHPDPAVRYDINQVMDHDWFKLLDIDFKDEKNKQMSSIVFMRNNDNMMNQSQKMEIDAVDLTVLQIREMIRNSSVREIRHQMASLITDIESFIKKFSGFEVELVSVTNTKARSLCSEVKSLLEWLTFYLLKSLESFQLNLQGHDADSDSKFNLIRISSEASSYRQMTSFLEDFIVKHSQNPLKLSYRQTTDKVINLMQAVLTNREVSSSMTNYLIPLVNDVFKCLGFKSKTLKIQVDIALEEIAVLFKELSESQRKKIVQKFTRLLESPKKIALLLQELNIEELNDKLQSDSKEMEECPWQHKYIN